MAYPTTRPYQLQSHFENPLCPTNWASDTATIWQARLLRAPQPGHLNRRLGGWQWGMRLMQEMLWDN